MTTDLIRTEQDDDLSFKQWMIENSVVWKRFLNEAANKTRFTYPIAEEVAFDANNTNNIDKYLTHVLFLAKRGGVDLNGTPRGDIERIKKLISHAISPKSQIRATVNHGFTSIALESATDISLGEEIAYLTDDFSDDMATWINDAFNDDPQIEVAPDISDSSVDAEEGLVLSQKNEISDDTPEAEEAEGDDLDDANDLEPDTEDFVPEEEDLVFEQDVQHNISYEDLTHMLRENMQIKQFGHPEEFNAKVAALEDKQNKNSKDKAELMFLKNIETIEQNIIHLMEDFDRDKFEFKKKDKLGHGDAYLRKAYIDQSINLYDLAKESYADKPAKKLKPQLLLN